tara:strand:- start:107 stop:673 length:567 start_codon:yes stop_codon:yes gene_type:complete
MIAKEVIKRFRLKDLGVIVLLALIWLGLDTVIIYSFNAQNSYIFSLVIGTLLMSLAVQLTKRFGTALLFYGISALLMQSINDIGTTGLNKFIILVFTGLLFEIVFLMLKLEVKDIQLDILIGTAISTATIPLTTGILLSFNVAQNMINSLLNMMLLSFFIGIVGAVLSFMVWYHFRKTKFVLKFEYGI